jgi:hypothetical protein
VVRTTISHVERYHFLAWVIIFKIIFDVCPLV